MEQIAWFLIHFDNIDYILTDNLIKNIFILNAIDLVIYRFSNV